MVGPSTGRTNRNVTSTEISTRIGDNVAAGLDAAAGRTALPPGLLSALATPNLDRLGSALAAAGSTSRLNLTIDRIAQDAVKASRLYDIQLVWPDLARSIAALNKSTALAALATQPRFNIDPDYFKQLSATLAYPALDPEFLAQLSGTSGVLADPVRPGDARPAHRRAGRAGTRRPLVAGPSGSAAPDVTPAAGRQAPASAGVLEARAVAEVVTRRCR